VQPKSGDVLDAFGDHLVCCHKNGLTKRHNAVVDCLAKFIKAAGLPVIVDRAVGLEPRLRPGDITLPRWQGVSPLYVDITIFHIPLRCLLTGISYTQAWRISQRRKESSA